MSEEEIIKEFSNARLQRNFSSADHGGALDAASVLKLIPKGLGKVQLEIVETIEECLVQAKAGAYVAFAACYVRPEMGFGSVVGGTPHGAALLGASVALQHRLLDATGEDKDYEVGPDLTVPDTSAPSASEEKSDGEASGVQESPSKDRS